MAKPVRPVRRGPAGARDPKAYALSVAGAVLVLLGLVVVDSLVLVAAGAGLAVAGWLVARRTG